MQVFQLVLEIRNQDVSQVCLVPFFSDMHSAVASRKRCYFADMTLVRSLQVDPSAYPNLVPNPEPKPNSASL